MRGIRTSFLLAIAALVAALIAAIMDAPVPLVIAVLVAAFAAGFWGSWLQIRLWWACRGTARPDRTSVAVDRASGAGRGSSTLGVLLIVFVLLTQASVMADHDDEVPFAAILLAVPTALIGILLILAGHNAAVLSGAVDPLRNVAFGYIVIGVMMLLQAGVYGASPWRGLPGALIPWTAAVFVIKRYRAWNRVPASSPA